MSANPEQRDEMQVYNSSLGIAELMGTPSDIPKVMQEKFFPFMNKIGQLSNLSEKEILNLLDELELKRIYMKTTMTEDEFDANFDMETFVQLRAYLTAALSCSRDGFMVKRLTTVYRHETLDSGPTRTGFLSSLMGGGK